MTENTSHKRTDNYVLQIKRSVFYKLGAILASFLAVPIMLQYLGIERYGVWSTLLTILSWIVFFDLGIGNGLRNGVATALAENKLDDAANISASGYTIIGVISAILWIITFVSIKYVNWQVVFNSSAIPEMELRLAVQIAAFFVVLNLWVGLVSALIGSVQKTAVIALQQMLVTIFVLLLVLLLIRIVQPALTYMAFGYGFAVFIVNITLSVWFFRVYPFLRPRLYINKKASIPLLSLGLRFLVLQITVLVIFTTDKILITHLLGPEHVAKYDVVYKLFSVVTVAYGIISAPLWSAYTDAFSRNDMAWIKSMLAKQLYIFAGGALVVVCLGLLTRPVLVLWLGDDLGVTGILIVSMAALTLITVWNNIFAIFVNGIGKLKVQVITAVIGAVINIPLSIFFVSYVGLGVSGVVMATCASLLIGSVIIPIQVKRLITKYT